MIGRLKKHSSPLTRLTAPEASLHLGSWGLRDFIPFRLEHHCCLTTQLVSTTVLLQVMHSTLSVQLLSFHSQPAHLLQKFFLNIALRLSVELCLPSIFAFSLGRFSSCTNLSCKHGSLLCNAFYLVDFYADDLRSKNTKHDLIWLLSYLFLA